MLQRQIEQILVDKAAGVNNKRLLNVEMPNHLKGLLAGYTGTSLFIYGRHSMSHIDSFVPWVAITFEAKTTTVQYHIYIVFLFAKDGSKVSLSLNLGVTHLKEQKKTSLGRKVTHKQFLNACAQQLLALITTPAGYLEGDLDLVVPRTSESVGKYYQYSNILAKEYYAGSVPTEADILADVLVLLEKCEELNRHIPDYDRFVADVISSF